MELVKDSAGILDGYRPGPSFCEMFGGGNGLPHTEQIANRLSAMPVEDLRRRHADAERELFNLGITFTVYSERDAIDRVLPFDVIPRVLSAADWSVIEAGTKQRVAAINLFLKDIYTGGKIIEDGVIPAELVYGNANYRPEMVDLVPPNGTYVHIAGIDIIRDGEGGFYVLEDNCRTPSGVSYVIENRHLMQRAFSDLIAGMRIRRVSDYGLRLHAALRESCWPRSGDPQVVLLTPGTYNSAYFEHIFLAREMGVPLVEGRDLVVGTDDIVRMKTTQGLRRVDVVYRRIDDAFLDPEAFHPDSMLGVPGLMRAYRAGNVSLANAVGTGVADDKAVYAYMPRIIRYYLQQDPILPNVETWICREPEGLAYTLANLDRLVVKPVGESGGYGITIGPLATKDEIEACRKRLEAAPENFISQPMINLSVCPTLVENGVQPRRVDLRPFVVTGSRSWVLPGGLTRVALREGSMIVNSSQGGGTKDTWVLD